MKRLNNKQSGVSGFGFGAILVLLAVGTTIGLKLLPIYMEHFSVTSSLDALQTADKNMSMDGVRPRLLRNFEINDVTSVGSQHIKIKHLGQSKNEVTTDYEVRRKLFGNIDIVVHFIDTVEINDP